MATAKRGWPLRVQSRSPPPKKRKTKNEKKMQNINLFKFKLILLFLIVSISICLSQVTLTYSLSNNLEENQNLHDAFLPVDNANSENGFFGDLLVPNTTCPDTFSLSGYYFYDNAGLQFENNQFIDCEYSIQFTFKVDDLSRPPSWV